MVSVILNLPQALRCLADGQASLPLVVEDDTLAGALLALLRTHPAVARRLLRPDGTLQSDAGLFLGDGRQAAGADMATQLSDGAILTIILPQCV
jgi:hypothetical protein